MQCWDLWGVPEAAGAEGWVDKQSCPLLAELHQDYIRLDEADKVPHLRRGKEIGNRKRARVSRWASERLTRLQSDFATWEMPRT